MTKQYLFGVSELNEELEDELGFGEELDEEDFNEIKINPPKKSSFPWFVFSVAVIKDALDFVSLGLLGIFTNIFCWIVISLWLRGKVSFIKRWLYKKYVFTRILEFIPIVNMLPQNSFFVLRGYANEKERINRILEALEFLMIKYKKGKSPF